jgi:UDP-N-acetylglucosamine transferase subunit ALG13
MRNLKRSRIRLALVCTGGGHFEQMMNLRDLYEGYSHFWITSPGQQTRDSLSGERAYFLNLAHFSKPWTYLAQIPRCIWIFARERPTRLLSTGSGRLGFVPIILALICQVKVIHIETFSHVNRLTKLGRFLAAVKYPITSQWPGNCGQNVEYIGPILMGKEAGELGPRESRHVFVTLGTREEPFPRLLEAVEALVKEGTIKERVIVQAGSTRYRSEVLEIFSFRPPAVIDDLIMNASYVITQESAGIGTKCLRYNKKMIVMPRDYDRGELPAKSDMNEDLHVRLQELGYAFVAQDAAELKSAIGNIPALKVGFPFDNRPAIAKLRALIEAS